MLACVPVSSDLTFSRTQNECTPTRRTHSSHAARHAANLKVYANSCSVLAHRRPNGIIIDGIVHIAGNIRQKKPRAQQCSPAPACILICYVRHRSLHTFRIVRVSGAVTVGLRGCLREMNAQDACAFFIRKHPFEWNYKLCI